MAVIKGTSGNDSLKGTSSADLIYGYGGNDTIIGGAGIDTMYGGKGNDTYEISDSKDVIKEYAGEGIDTVIADVSYTLGNNIENLWLRGYYNINATGNSLNNHIYGNDVDNIINGGAGADTMEGGDGNDTYYVDNPGDVIAEWIDGGTDTVISSITYKLPWAVIENLTLSGNKNISGYGNDLDNVIKGNYANNYLYGDAGNDTIAAGSGNDTINGGTENDSLLGGAGNDLYQFVAGDGKDIVSDMGGTDTIKINTLKKNASFHYKGNDLIINYTKSDSITIKNQKIAANAIEKIQFSDGKLSNSDINSVIQSMTSFASNQGAQITSTSDSQNNNTVNTIIANSWHS